MAKTELWDLYDRNGNLTGEVWERRHGNYINIPEGLYHLVSDILVQHRDGSYLLTKRHIDKDLYPGYWEASAGGSAQLGESPEECAKRELFEETGILSDRFELVKITFSNRSPSLIYSYVARVDCDKNSVVLQEGETTEYKWVDAAGLIEYAESELAIKTSVERYKSFYDKVSAHKGINITDMELSRVDE
jgi:8-oxo-dGTP pyrophosphatase MutT (NUDIX family)